MGAASASKRHDLELIEPFLLAIMDTVKTVGQLDVKVGTPYLKGQGPAVAADRAAVFGVLSRAASTTVSVALLFRDPDYATLMEKIFQHPPSESDVSDGIGELVSLIFSRVKKLMNLDGQIIRRMIPTIVFGKDLKVSYLTSGQSVIVPLETEAGTFHLELTME